jgi:hypothetical protein
MRRGTAESWVWAERPSCLPVALQAPWCAFTALWAAIRILTRAWDLGKKLGWTSPSGSPTGAFFNNLDYDYNSIKECCVKLIITNKTDFVKFDKFLDNLYQCNLIELKILEDLSQFEDSVVNEDIDLDDTMSLLKDYVDGIETINNKEKLKNLLQTIYVEAQDYV